MGTQKPNSPLLGYNTNVKHSDRQFHIQTEDSGIDHPHVITHLFTTGTILATKRTSYVEFVGVDDLETHVRQMMKDQHKAMFIELREGVHDAIAARILGECIGRTMPDGTALEEPMMEIEQALPPPPPEELRPSQVQVIVPADMNKIPIQPKKPVSKDAAAVSQARLYSLFETPDASGTFGESLISDKSLDEVIMTFLEDELDE